MSVLRWLGWLYYGGQLTDENGNPESLILQGIKFAVGLIVLLALRVVFENGGWEPWAFSLGIILVAALAVFILARTEDWRARVKYLQSEADRQQRAAE